jgi:hypothetical protein
MIQLDFVTCLELGPGYVYFELLIERLLSFATVFEILFFGISLIELVVSVVASLANDLIDIDFIMRV